MDHKADLMRWGIPRAAKYFSWGSVLYIGGETTDGLLACSFHLVGSLFDLHAYIPYMNIGSLTL